MSYFIHSFSRYLRFWIYLFLLSFSLWLSYRENKIIHYDVDSWRLEWTGKINRITALWTHLIDLKDANRYLTQENVRLYKLLNKSQQKIKTPFNINFAYILPGKFKGRNQYVIIDKGDTNNVQKNDGVWGPQGAVGIVMQTSPHFSKVRLLTHPEISLSVKIRHTDDYGFTSSTGENGPFVYITDIPFESRVYPGDTIETSGASLIFPPHIPVGKVFGIEQKSPEEKILLVELFANPRKIKYVYIGNHPLRQELMDLKNED